MSQAKAVLALHTIDHTLDEFRARLKTIRAVIADDAESKAAQALVDSLQEQLKPLRLQSRSLDDEIANLRQKASEIEQQLYSGNVSSPKALQELQDELNALKNRSNTLEDTLLALMLTLEADEASLAAAEQALEALLGERASQHKDLIAEIEALKAQAAVVQASRNDAALLLTDANRALYESLKPRMRGTTVTPLRDGVCGICGVEPTRSVEQEIDRGIEVVQCPNCQRILVKS